MSGADMSGADTSGADTRGAGVSKGPAASAGTGSDAVPSYEAARDELAQVVRALENGGVTLEESLALWERGEALARVCEQWLEGARARLAAVVETGDDEA
jgi:exodeoxyribonuclease VII small subunit